MKIRIFFFKLNEVLGQYLIYRFFRYIFRRLKENFISYLWKNSLVLKEKRSMISSFKNKHLGESIFIIGNGPSINSQDLNQLKDKYTFACNAFYLKSETLDWRPTYYTVEDIHPAFDNRKKIQDLEKETIFIPNDLSWMYKKKKNLFFINFERSYLRPSNQKFPSFSKDSSIINFWGSTVPYLCIQIAAYLGFKRIFLIGIDLTYSIPEDAKIVGNVITTKGKDPNHFDERYFGFGKKWHIPDTKLMNDSLVKAFRECKKNKIELVNCTEGGNLSDVPRMKFQDALKL